MKLHLIRSELCRRSLHRRGHYVHPVEGACSLVDRALHRNNDGLLPPLQALGPLPLPGGRADEVNYDLELFEEIFLKLLDTATEDDAECFIRSCVDSRAITWERCCATFGALREEATLEDLSPLPIGAAAFHSGLARLGRPDSWPFLLVSDDLADGHWNRDARTLAALLRSVVKKRPRHNALRLFHPVLPRPEHSSSVWT